MKTKILTFAVFANLQLALCQIYYPLQVGNLWQYQEPPPPPPSYTVEERIVRDTVMPDGLSYRRFIRRNIGYQDTIGWQFLRQEGGRVYGYFWDSRNIPVLRYDFSKNVGDTVSIYPVEGGQDTAIVTILDKGSHVIFGKARRYVTFWLRRYRTSFYWIDRITDSIGVTFVRVEPGLQLNLSGAVINETTYGTVTSVPKVVADIPKNFSLYQNYPNPFNPSTQITFSVPNDGVVSLKVFDVLGREVAVLVDEFKHTGTYHATFNASSLPSGVYLYKLEAAGKSIVQKMMLLR